MKHKNLYGTSIKNVPILHYLKQLIGDKVVFLFHIAICVHSWTYPTRKYVC